MDLLGKSGASLIPFLNSMSASSEEARRLHLIIGGDLVQAGAALDDNLKTIDATLDGLKNRIVSEVLPSLVGYSQQLIEISANSDARKFSGVAQGLLTVVATVDACVTGLEQLWLRLEDVAELASLFGTSPSSIGVALSSYLANRKLRGAEYDRLNSRFWDRMGALYNPQPLPVPEVKRGSVDGGDGSGGTGNVSTGRGTLQSSAAAVDAAAVRIRALLAEIASANGDAAEKVRLQWSNKAEDIRRLFEKFPQLIREFGRVDLLADLTGRMAELKEQTKAEAEALEEANKAYAELAKANQNLPNLGAVPSTVPSCKPIWWEPRSIASMPIVTNRRDSLSRLCRTVSPLRNASQLSWPSWTPC
jgi:hypothetical protein